TARSRRSEASGAPSSTQGSAGRSGASALELDRGLREDVPAVGHGGPGRCERAGEIAVLALAAGEVEVALEVALLDDGLGAAQDEPVRVEEAAEIDVGEDPGRRRVARLLEAVQLDRGERVDGSELVDD